MARVKREGLAAARHLQGDIYEVRASTQDKNIRVLFAQEGQKGRVLLAVHAFQKQTQKTRGQDIELAQHRLQDWRDRARRQAHQTDRELRQLAREREPGHGGGRGR